MSELHVLNLGAGVQLLSVAVLLAAGLNLAVLRTRRKIIRLVIHSAYYGIGKATDLNVTDKLNAFVLDNRLVLTVSNWALSATDPYPNQWKRLKIDYSFGSIRRTVTVNENAPLRLPEEEPYAEASGT